MSLKPGDVEDTGCIIVGKRAVVEFGVVYIPRANLARAESFAWQEIRHLSTDKMVAVSREQHNIAVMQRAAQTATSDPQSKMRAGPSRYRVRVASQSTD